MVSTEEIVKADLMRSGNIISSSESWEIVEARELSKSREASKDFTKRSRSDNHHNRFARPIRCTRVEWLNQLNLGTVRNI